MTWLYRHKTLMVILGILFPLIFGGLVIVALINYITLSNLKIWGNKTFQSIIEDIEEEINN